MLRVAERTDVPWSAELACAAEPARKGKGASLMSRLNAFLAIMLLLSSFWLIRSSNEARHLFVDLENRRRIRMSCKLNTSACRLKASSGHAFAC